MLLICGLKFNLSSNWILKSSTEGSVLICLVSITKFWFAWSPFFIYYYITWNLSGFTIVWFFLNQSDITSDSLCKILINFDMFSAKTDKVLSFAKLCTDAINMKKNVACNMWHVVWIFIVLGFLNVFFIFCSFDQQQP